jgi:hypothetical protein
MDDQIKSIAHAWKAKNGESYSRDELLEFIVEQYHEGLIERGWLQNTKQT